MKNNLWTQENSERSVYYRPFMPDESIDGIFIEDGIVPKIGGWIYHDALIPKMQWYVPPVEERNIDEFEIDRA